MAEKTDELVIDRDRLTYKQSVTLMFLLDRMNAASAAAAKTGEFDFDQAEQWLAQIDRFHELMVVSVPESFWHPDKPAAVAVGLAGWLDWVTPSAREEIGVAANAKKKTT